MPASLLLPLMCPSVIFYFFQQKVLRERGVDKVALLAALSGVGVSEALVEVLENEEKAEKWYGAAPRHFFRRVAGELFDEHFRPKSGATTGAAGGGLGARLKRLVGDLVDGMSRMPPSGGGPPAIFAKDVELHFAVGSSGGPNVIELLSDDDT